MAADTSERAGTDLLTVAQAAEELGLSIRGVQDRLRRGKLRGIQPSPRIWLIPRDEVDIWKGRGKFKAGRPRRGATQ